MHETEKNFGPFRSFQPQAESGGCVVLSGHLAAMMAPPGRPGGVVVGYPPRTPAQARVCAAPGDVPAPCPRGPRGYRSMVRVAIGALTRATHRVSNPCVPWCSNNILSISWNQRHPLRSLSRSPSSYNPPKSMIVQYEYSCTTHRSYKYISPSITLSCPISSNSK